MLRRQAHRDSKNFYITNPNMGASVDEETLLREWAKAEEAGEEDVRGFLAKHLNVEIGLALRSDRWAGAVEIGIDGGGLDDLLGLAVLGRDTKTGDWLHWGHAWAHPSVLERRKSEAPRLLDFAKAGHLTLVERIGEDVIGVADVVARCERAGLLDRIGVDVAGIGAILDELEARGIDKKRIVGISQGWKLCGAIKTAERKLAEGTLHHGDSPLIAWAVGNAKVEPRGNAITITKQAAGYAKIDPLMALLNAVELMSTNPTRRKMDVDAWLASPEFA